MRGKASSLENPADCSGITPAYAGKSSLSSKVERNHRDHPRLCGEKDTQVTGKPSNRGSPPPMRGKAACATPTDRITGITPAYAGKSVLQLCQRHKHRDHPRLCGEKRVELGTNVNR